MRHMTTREARKIGALGGMVSAAKSKAKAAALAALHSSRRGKRVRPDNPDRAAVIEAAVALLREPEYGIRSVRVLAEHCSVDQRTLRRWLSGEDWPPAEQVHRIAKWCRHFGRTTKNAKAITGAEALQR